MEQIIVREETYVDENPVLLRKNIDREIENLGLSKDISDKAKNIYERIGTSFHKKNRTIIEIGCVASINDSNCDMISIMQKNGISLKSGFKALSQTSYKTKENIYKLDDSPLNYFDSIYSELNIAFEPDFKDKVKKSILELNNYLKKCDESPRNVMIAIFKIQCELVGIKVEKKLLSLIQTEKNKFPKIYNDIKNILIN